MRIWILATLFAFSLLPSAYLRYYPFRHGADAGQKKRLRYGHLALFALQTLLVGLAFSTGWLAVKGTNIERLYYYSFLPHFLLLTWTIRPYWFYHVFILGIQSIHMFLVHTTTMAIVFHGLGMTPDTINFLIYLSIYDGLLLATLPGMLWLFDRVVPEEKMNPLPGFWRFLGPLPLAMTYYQNFMMPYWLMNGVWDFLISRILLVGMGGFSVMMLHYGMDHYKQTVVLQNRNKNLSSRLEQMNRYTRLVQEEQRKQAIIRHDGRHQLRILQELAKEGYYEEGEAMLERLLKELKL